MALLSAACKASRKEMGISGRQGQYLAHRGDGMGAECLCVAWDGRSCGPHCPSLPRTGVFGLGDWAGLHPDSVCPGWNSGPGQTLGLVSLVTKSHVVVFVSDAWSLTPSQVCRNPGRLARGACYLWGLKSRPVQEPCPTAPWTQDALRCFYLFSVSNPWTCANNGNISVLHSQPV